MDIAWLSTFLVHSLLFLKVEQKTPRTYANEETSSVNPFYYEVFFLPLTALLGHLMSFKAGSLKMNTDHIWQVGY
jgi:hypothetical protein